MVNTVKFSEFAQASLGNATNSLVGVTSSSGGVNMQVPSPLSWDTSARPISPVAGTFGYNSSLSQLEFWNGVTWIQLASGGSGTVSLGAQNEVAYYPANGTTIDGLTTANNAGLFSNGTGVPSMVVATGTGAPVRNTSPTLVTPTLVVASATSMEFSSTAGIIGSTTNDSANAGSVGEYQPSVISLSSAVTLTTLTPADLTSLVLHAGDWDIWGNITIRSSLFTISVYSGWLNTVSITQPDSSLSFTDQFSGSLLSQASITAPSRRFSFSSPTTIYLSAQATFSGGTVNMCGGLYARLRR